MNRGLDIKVLFKIIKFDVAMMENSVFCGWAPDFLT